MYYKWLHIQCNYKLEVQSTTKNPWTQSKLQNALTANDIYDPRKQTFVERQKYK